MYLDTVRRLTVRGRHYLNYNTIIPTAKCYLPKLNKFRKYLSFEEVREKEKTPDIQTLQPGSGFQKSFPIGFPSWTVSDLPGLEKYFSKSDENVKIFHYYDTFGSPRVDAGLGYSALVADVDANRCVLGHSDGLGIE